MHMIKFNFDAQSSSQTHFLDANFHQQKNKKQFNGYASVAQPYKPQTNPKQLNLEQPHLDVLHSYASVIQAHTTAQHLNVTTVTHDASKQRLALEHFIRDKYQKVHQASINTFSDTLFAGYVNYDMQVVIGMQPLGANQAFLEQYLGAPIETILTQLSQVPVTRAQIVEIGNLAAQDMSKAKLMVAFLVFHLSQNNVSWAVCTGTAAVRYVLQQMGLHFQVLEKANPEALGDAQHQWGSYYQQKPYVLAIDVAAALAVTQQQYCFYA